MIPNRLLILYTLIALPTFLFAQTYVGFKGGINRSQSNFVFNLNPNTITASGNLDGFYFSIPVEVTGKKLIDFLTEVALISDGSILSVQRQAESRTYNNTILFVKVPLLAKVKLLQHKDYELSMIGGIVPAYALDVKSTYFTLADLRTFIDVPISFEQAGIRRFDAGIALGLNTHKVIAKGWKITLDLRYQFGLLNLENRTELTTTTESFSLALGILTPIFSNK